MCAQSQLQTAVSRSHLTMHQTIGMHTS